MFDVRAHRIAMLDEEYFDSMDDSEPSGPSYVYFLTIVDPKNPDYDFGFVKVGITKGAVERRIESLQTGNPYQIYCAGKFQSPVASAVECWLHRTRSVARLEWLHLRRDQIQELVAEAQRESDRLAHIAAAWNHWREVQSNGVKRKPSVEEQRLHDEVCSVTDKLLFAQLQLQLTIVSVAVVTGKVGYIPGIIKTLPFSPFGRFSANNALEQFGDLAAKHMVEKVSGRFLWKHLPTRAEPQFAQLKKRIELLTHTREALDGEMLRNRDCFLQEGTRTDELIDLHEQFINLMQQTTQLKIDKEYLRAQMIQTMENAEAVDGVCSFGRRPKPVLNAESFRTAYHEHALQCRSTPPAVIVRRRIFLSRAH
jgi:hypothetical protein